MRGTCVIVTLLMVASSNTSQGRPAPEGTCGNRVIDPGEQCDGSRLGGVECTDLGYAGGRLLCRDDCFFDGTSCDGDGGCGNGAVDSGEECDDGNDVGHDGCTDCIIGEFLISSDPASYFSSVALAPDGGFVVAWQAVDGSYVGIFTRAFDRRGFPMTDNVLVNINTDDYQGRPEVARGLSGSFMVTWIGEAQDGEDHGVFSRVLDAWGNPIGPERQVNVTWEGDQEFKDVEAMPDGRYIVVYRSVPEGGALLARFIDDTGEPAGSEIVIDTGEFTHSWPAIGVTPDGFIVAWQCLRDLESTGICMRAFDRMGEPVAATAMISPDDTIQRTYPAILVVDSNRMILGWQRESEPEESSEMIVQCFDTTGSPLGDEIVMDADTPVATPELARVAEDRVVVVWKAWTEPPTRAHVAGAEIDLACNPLAPSFRVSTLGDAGGARPRIASPGDGRYIIVWDSNSTDVGFVGPVAKLYGSDGTPAYPGAW